MTIGRVTVGRRDVLVMAVAAFGVLVFVLVSSSMHAVGFPLDDAWIHQTYARNLAERGEWAFVPGEPSVASTSPLYTVLLAVGYVLDVDFFVWAFVVGVVALAATGWIASRLAKRLFPDMAHIGIWTGLAVVTTWHLVWAAASGMETIFFAALSLGVVWLGWRELDVHARSGRTRNLFGRGTGAGLAGAALTLARPEGVGMLGLVLLLVLLAWPRGFRRDGLRAYAAWAAGIAVGWLLGVAPYLVVNYSIEGTLLPNTSAAKQAEYAAAREAFIGVRYVRLLLPLFAGAQIALLPGIVLSISQLARRVRQDRKVTLLLLPFAWAVMDLSAYAIRLPVAYQHARYVMPILPHLVLYGVGGTFLLLQHARRKPFQRVLSRTLGLTAIVLVPGFLAIGARQYGADVRIINTEMVATAKWVRDHVPEDDLLAVHDIGAVGYYAPRPILDLAGLVTPEVVPIIRDDAAVMRLMCERDARYLMVFPDQRPVPESDSRLGGAPVFVTNAPYAPEAGGGNMVIYALVWGSTCR